MSDLEHRITDLIQQMTLKEKVSLLSGRDAWRTVAIERLGIPSVMMTDGPHGVRANFNFDGRKGGPTTYFPTGVSFAATWNPELIERVGEALAEETRAMGADILLGPCVNIARHPLAGRNFESYAEDPFLAGRIGVAWVEGVQSRGVGTSLKHFACNNQEFERFRGSSEVDERTLREIYLPAFEAIIKEARPWTIMCAYNRINGVHASQNRRLLTDILREEWGFDGVVVSDWGANHTIVESVAAGLDIEMPGPAKYYGPLLVQAVEHWQLEEEVIDRAVRRVLRLIFRCGKMNGRPRPAGAVNTPEHQSLAREVAEEAITLLKNDGAVLPLAPSRLQTLAVIGPNADSIVSGGGSSTVQSPLRVSPLEALRKKLDGRVRIEYLQGCANTADVPIAPPEFFSLSGGGGPGLRGEYFNNSDFSGQPALVRTDAQINCWWGEEPDPVVDFHRFCVRWTGVLRVPESGPYTLRLFTMGGGRMYLDGELLLDNPVPTEGVKSRGSAVIERVLEAGRAYPIQVDFIKTPGHREVTGPARFNFHCGFPPEYRAAERIQQAADLARRCDAALIFAGYGSGHETEGHDRPDMNLTGPQDDLIRAVAAANPKTAVILQCGSPVTMPWIDAVPAVVVAWYSGMLGGEAIASVLLGEVNASGKLPVTFPRRLQDTPAYHSYPGGRQVFYGEGVFVGYRHYDYRDVEPLFPFGHGLSYTTFEYGDLQAPGKARAGQTVRVSLRIKNTGAVAGKETVQLYVADKQSRVARPPKELKAFAKVALAPGESRLVTFDLTERAFAFYDPVLAQWVVEPGEFELLAGASSRDIRARAEVELT